VWGRGERKKGKKKRGAFRKGKKDVILNRLRDTSEKREGEKKRISVSQGGRKKKGKKGAVSINIGGPSNGGREKEKKNAVWRGKMAGVRIPKEGKKGGGGRDLSLRDSKKKKGGTPSERGLRGEKKKKTLGAQGGVFRC